MQTNIDLAIIGAQKAGTTALKNYIGEHPDVLSHPHTEFTYFADDNEYETDDSIILKKYFGVTEKRTQKLVVKNVTLSFREHTIERLYKHSPNCHLVLVIREPISRAFSSYQMAVRSGWMDKPFSYAEKAIQNNANGQKDTFYRFMLDLGIYHKQLETIYKYFDKEKVSVFLFEDFKKDPLNICQQIFQILGVKEDYMPNTNKKHNVGGLPRSKQFSRLLKKLKENNNPFKKLSKFILSEQSFIKLSQSLSSFNLKKSEKIEMDSLTKGVLEEFYKPLNDECSKLIGIDLNQMWYE